MSVGGEKGGERWGGERWSGGVGGVGGVGGGGGGGGGGRRGLEVRFFHLSIINQHIFFHHHLDEFKYNFIGGLTIEDVADIQHYVDSSVIISPGRLNPYGYQI